MRLRMWRETKEIRAINTGSEMMEVRKGDVVACFVIERWEDDPEKAIESLRALLKGTQP